MGLFDLFKKKEEPAYDPTNISIKDLDKGFVFDYDLKTWIVKEVYEYDWGNNNFTKEFKVDSGDEVWYLHLEDDDEIFITVTKKVKIRAIDEDLPERIKKKEKPPKKLEYKGHTLYRDEETMGYFKPVDKETDDWDELISWEYYDDEDQYVLSIEQWGDDEFEAAFGKVAKEHQFSNILPGNN
ncbi:MAG: DUF4178 domain-containing protein [Bacteroidota bacterium]